jgi:hypothetical protein
VLLYTDRPVGGTDWRYAALAPDRARLTELEVRLAAALRAAAPVEPSGGIRAR